MPILPSPIMPTLRMSFMDGLPFFGHSGAERSEEPGSHDHQRREHGFRTCRCGDPE
jgi:hypothetical protein